MNKTIEYGSTVFARFKAYAQRSLLYYQLINSLLILMLFLRDYNLSVFITIAIITFAISLIIVIGMLDRKLKILEREQSYYNKENKELQEIITKLEDIEDRL